MNELQIFENAEFGKIRTILVDGVPHFVAADVFTSFGSPVKHHMLSSLAEKYKALHPVQTPSGVQKMVTLTEAGVYMVLMKMNPNQAKKKSEEYRREQTAKLERFQDWIASEVLPSIRKHGAYMTPETLEQMIANPQFGITLLTALQQERDRANALQESNARLAAKVAADESKVAFAERVSVANNVIGMKEFAQIYSDKYHADYGRTRLFDRLRELKIIQQGGKVPYQQFVDRGYFVVTEFLRRDGVVEPTTKITGKGQIWLTNKLLQADGALKAVPAV